MNVTIDVGNSHIKVGFFEQEKPVEFLQTDTQKELIRMLEKRPADYAIVCSVTKSAEVIQEILSNYVRRAFALTHQLPVPVENYYQTPETLGMDRLAGVVGASVFFPGESSLVIDAGTCLKYDFLDTGRHYRGGSISPGLRMRFQAMHQFTASLPLLSPEPKPPLTGTDTFGAMQSGVLNGVIAEINGITERYREAFPGCRVLLTGGDAAFFETHLKFPIFAAPKLVLVGLNRILQYNVYQK
jgi:type III pantothenate kinase